MGTFIWRDAFALMHHGIIHTAAARFTDQWANWIWIQTCSITALTFRELLTFNVTLCMIQGLKWHGGLAYKWCASKAFDMLTRNWPFGTFIWGAAFALMHHCTNWTAAAGFTDQRANWILIQTRSITSFAHGEHLTLNWTFFVVKKHVEGIVKKPLEMHFYTTANNAKGLL